MIIFADDLELARSITLGPRFDPSKLGAQLFMEGSRSCPIQYDYNGGMRNNSILGLCEMLTRAAYEGAGDRMLDTDNWARMMSICRR